MLELRKYPDSVLTQKCSLVSEVDDSIRKLMDTMFKVMEQSMGQGLAAPQIGVLQRVIVMKVDDIYYALANPRIFDPRGKAKDEEGCLSIPGVKVEVPRAASLKVEGLDLDGDSLTLDAKDDLARVIQHEVDHIDGKLIIDYLPKAERLNFDLNYLEAMEQTAP